MINFLNLAIGYGITGKRYFALSQAANYNE